MTPGPTARAAERAGAHGFLGREGEFAVVRSYSFLIVFTSQSARHATTTPTCPRRSRCAPKLSTNCDYQAKILFQEGLSQLQLSFCGLRGVLRRPPPLPPTSRPRGFVGSGCQAHRHPSHP